MGLFDRWHEECENDSSQYTSGTNEVFLERKRIARLIAACADTYDPGTDADVPAYLRNLAKRIGNGEL